MTPIIIALPKNKIKKKKKKKKQILELVVPSLIRGHTYQINLLIESVMSLFYHTAGQSQILAALSLHSDFPAPS